MVLEARERVDDRSRRAFETLCEAYWYPLYAFLRRRGHDADDALDLVQAFFVYALETGFLKTVQPGLGRFRSFMLSSLKKFLSRERDRKAAAKRGGTCAIESLDGGDAERRYRVEPKEDWTPERSFEYSWALMVLQHARDRLSRELQAAGKERQYALLSEHLAGEEGSRSYKEIAPLLDTTEAGVKMAVYRLRKRLGKLVREEIAQTVRDETEVDSEVRHLFAVLNPAERA